MANGLNYIIQLIAKVTGAKDVKDMSVAVKDTGASADTAAPAIDEAGNEVEEFGEKSSEASDKAGKLGSSMDSLAGKAKIVATGIAAAATASIWAAAEQEKVDKSVKAAAEARGMSAEETLRQATELSAKLQDLTTYGDEETLKMQAMAISMGASMDDMEQIMQNAVGLRQSGMDLNMAVRGAVLASMGDYTTLREFIPELRVLTDEAEIAAAAQDFMTRKFEEAKAAVDTLAGALGQFKNELGDVAQALGGPWVDDIKAIVVNIKDFLKWFKELPEGVQKAIGGFAAMTAAAGYFLSVLIKLRAALAIIKISKFGTEAVAAAKGVETLTRSVAILNKTKAILSKAWLPAAIVAELAAVAYTFGEIGVAMYETLDDTETKAREAAQAIHDSFVQAAEAAKLVTHELQAQANAADDAASRNEAYNQVIQTMSSIRQKAAAGGMSDAELHAGAQQIQELTAIKRQLEAAMESNSVVDSYNRGMAARQGGQVTSFAGGGRAVRGEGWSTVDVTSFMAAGDKASSSGTELAEAVKTRADQDTELARQLAEAAQLQSRNTASVVTAAQGMVSASQQQASELAALQNRVAQLQARVNSLR